VVTGCGDEEMLVDRLQNQLRQVSVQITDLRARAREAGERASDARNRAMRALEVRDSVRARRAQGEGPGDEAPLRSTQLTFTTDRGRALLDAYGRREISPSELRSRLTDLGEHEVVNQIVAEGRRQIRRDPTIPWPEERQAVGDAIAARDELRVHLRDAEASRVEAEELARRERELTEELAVARVRLDDCRNSQTGRA
jgi:hypothetical protein